MRSRINEFISKLPLWFILFIYGIVTAFLVIFTINFAKYINVTDKGDILALIQTVLSIGVFAPTIYILIRQIADSNTFSELHTMLIQRDDNDIPMIIFKNAPPTNVEIKNAVVAVRNIGNTVNNWFIVRVFIPLELYHDNIAAISTQGNQGQCVAAPSKEENSYVITFLSNGQVGALPDDGLEVIAFCVLLEANKQYKETYPIRCTIVSDKNEKRERTFNLRIR